MLTVNTRINDSLSSNTRLWKLRVEVTRNNVGAIPVDISDRVTSCDVSFDFENRNGSASLEIDNFDYAYSPLNMTSSANQVGGVYDPLFDAKHIIKIYYGIRTVGGYEYIQRFTGVLGDEIDADSYPGIVSLTARDRSKDFQDTYIYQSKSYPVGLVAESVMQDMINEFIPNSGITIQVVAPTNHYVSKPDSPYTAKDTNLWDALQLLSDSFNHELRFMEDGTLRLKKVDRDLHNITPVKSFYESDLIKDSISLSDSDVRNHIVLRVQGLDPIDKKNEASIQKYGRRYMEVNRSMASLITTAEQGHELVNNLLKDLSYANPVDNIELPFYPLIQVGDVVTIENDRVGTTAANYIFRVVKTKDSFSVDRKRSTISLQGYTRFDPATSIAPNPPTSLVSSNISRTIQWYEGAGWNGSSKTLYYPMIQWTPPATDVNGNALTADFGGYTIYRKVNGTSNWFPLASVKSYIEALPLVVSYFYDYTVTPGLSYNYKIIAINSLGKTSVSSGELTVSVPNAVIT